MSGVLPEVGSSEDRFSSWVYLAITSRGEDADSQGFMLTVNTPIRQKAMELGRQHFRLLSTDVNGDHYQAILVEDWAYTTEEAKLLQWEIPIPEIVTQTKGVTVIETKRRKKK